MQNNGGMLEVSFKKHLKIEMFGHLHNVGIRFRLMTKAYECRISGFVMHGKQGSLYLEVEGTEPDLDEFIKFCKRRVPGAVINRIEIENGEIFNYNSFEMIG